MHDLGVAFGGAEPTDTYCIQQAGAGVWSWSGVREKYYYLTSDWRLVLKRCEREIL